MKANFVLESFDDYVKEVYPAINEGIFKADPLTESEVREIIESLVMKQRKAVLGFNNVLKLLKETFGESFLSKENLKNMKADINWADPSDVKDPEFFKKIQKFEDALINSKFMENRGSTDNSIEMSGAIVMGIFFEWMSTGTYKELIADIIKISGEKNISFKKITKQIEEKPFGLPKNLNLPPAILGYTSAGEIEKEEPPKIIPPQEISLLSEASQKTLFKNNSWDLEPTVAAELKDKLKAVFERRKAGGYSKILEFSIQSSASRYRNKGLAENLSWGQLSFKRSQVVHSMVKTVLQELEIPEGDPIREELNKVAVLDISGSNGDGTSGPNPMKDPQLGFLRVGYYETVNAQDKTNTGSSKFIDKDKNKPQEVYITKIDGFGNPKGSPTMKTMEPDTKVEDYDKYRFVNVIVKVQETSIVPISVEGASITKVPNNTLSPEVILSKKGTGGGGGFDFDFKFPKLPKLPRLFPIGIGSLSDCIDMCGGF
jgi:hypothetical protein